MALHLIKLCVGADSIDDLREWVSERSLIAISAGLEPHSSHITRMIPKRDQELLVDGISRCELVLGPEVIETELQPRRAFQGWRYLTEEDAPRDLKNMGDGTADLPMDLRRELAELGLL